MSGRLRSVVTNASMRELVLATALAAVVVGVLFGSHIRSGGFESDDWSLFVDARFPLTTGHSTGAAALAAAAGSRIGATVYWLAIFSLFGTHAKLYLLTAGVLTVAMSASLFVLMRTLRFSRLESAAVMVVSIAMPSVDVNRLWIIAAGGQICYVFFFLGLALALRAFEAPPPQRLRLHAASLALYAASAVYAEIAMPLVAVSLLVYMTRAPLWRSVKRWMLDLVIVAGCYAGTLVFVNEDLGFTQAPASQWWSRAELIYGQALTIFSATLMPFAEGDHLALFLLIGGLALAGALVWRRSTTAHATRTVLKRAAIAFAIAVVAAVAGWGTFIPSSYYAPLGEGIGTRINLVADAPLAVAAVSVIMYASALLREFVTAIFAKRATLARLRPLAAVALLGWAWLGYVVIDGAIDVRHDASLWTVSATQQYRLLGLLKYEVPHPVASSQFDTFGEAGMAAPGLPIFVQSWELNSAVKIAYDRPDLTGYPIVAGVDSIVCESNMVAVETPAATPFGTPSRYGHTYFVDAVTGAHELILSRAGCEAAAASFPPGPYALPNSWSL